MKRIVVLVSGNGSNLQAILDACQQGRINGSVAAVFSNKADAYGLQRARDAGPRLCLLIINQAWLIPVTLGKRLVSVDAFGDDQAKAAFGKPQVVLLHGLGGHPVCAGAYAGHRRDRQTIIQLHIFNNTF